MNHQFDFERIYQSLKGFIPYIVLSFLLFEFCINVFIHKDINLKSLK